MQQEPSTEEELYSLKPGFTDEISWIAFGNCSQENINDIEREWFPNSTIKRVKVHDIWARHPIRQQQGNVI
jgi:hypothetical protein